LAGASFASTDGARPVRCSGTNLDGDPFAGPNDNCPLIVQSSQTDSDGDGVGDGCDLCPALPDARQADLDRDGIGDRCDRCPFLPDTAQLDGDADGAGDVCDPAPADPARAVPSEAITLTGTNNRLTGVSRLQWTAEARSSRYELYRGTAAMVAARFYGTCQNGRDPNPLDRQFDESELPASGTAYFYLVLGVATDGTRGLAGVDSGGRLRDLRARDCR
jgi:hypothetical protein